MRTKFRLKTRFIHFQCLNGQSWTLSEIGKRNGKGFYTQHLREDMNEKHGASQKGGEAVENSGGLKP